MTAPPGQDVPAQDVPAQDAPAQDVPAQDAQPLRPVLDVRSVSKSYAIGLADTRRRGLRSIAREFSFRRHGPERLGVGEFWALHGVSFEVARGESFGILGLNGSGKSTLMRLIAGLTKPDRGEVVVRGRVGVLLDPLGGFSGLLTGRENARSSGLLWGVTEDELDEVVDRVESFAQLGAFLDEPVRTYSKGMRMRLAFAVSAHLNPDILLIDEALAVGDTRFQRRCSEFLRTFRNGGGSLVLVSHSLTAVQALTNRAIVLHRGRVLDRGAAGAMARRYAEHVAEFDRSTLPGPGTPKDDPPEPEPASPTEGGPVRIKRVTIRGPEGPVVCGQPARVDITYVGDDQLSLVACALVVYSVDGLVCIAGDVGLDDATMFELQPGVHDIPLVIGEVRLMPGPHLLRCALIESSTNMVIALHGFETPATAFDVADGTPPVAPTPFVAGLGGESFLPVVTGQWSVERAEAERTR